MKKYSRLAQLYVICSCLACAKAWRLYLITGREFKFEGDAEKLIILNMIITLVSTLGAVLDVRM